MFQLVYHLELYYRYLNLVTKTNVFLRTKESEIMYAHTQMDALKPCALISNVRFVIVNDIPSITRFIKPYLPTNLEAPHFDMRKKTVEDSYGSFTFVELCTSRNCSHVSISMVTSSNV